MTEEEPNVIMGTECCTAGFEDGGRGQVLRNAKNGALEKGRKARKLICYYSFRSVHGPRF